MLKTQFSRRGCLALGVGMSAMAWTDRKAFAQRALALATDRAGTTFNAIGTGIAKVAARHSGINISIRPFAGPDAWLPQLARSEIHLGAVSSFSAWEASQRPAPGRERIDGLRVLFSGRGSLYVGLIVAAASPIRTIADLRGARMAAGYGGHRAVLASIESVLAPAGLGWSDLRSVPVVGIVDGIDALVAGRVDACWVSLGQPQVREADLRIGIRYLPLINTPEAKVQMQRIAFPGARIETVPADAAPGVPAPTPLMTYDAYLITNNALEPNAATAIVQSLWDHNEELVSAHRSLGGFTKANAVTDLPILPYHPGAIEFFRAKGAWTEETDRLHRAAGLT
jgi:TRAP transporter TAXI family solute receptor